MEEPKSNIKQTTSEDFILFKEAALKQIAKLGLYNWRIDFQHTNCGSAYATTDHNVENHCAVIKFCIEWGEGDYAYNKENIELVGRHEIHHILLAKLAAYANYRFVTKIMLDQTEEEIIRILDKFL